MPRDVKGNELKKGDKVILKVKGKTMVAKVYEANRLLTIAWKGKDGKPRVAKVPPNRVKKYERKQQELPEPRSVTPMEERETGRFHRGDMVVVRSRHGKHPLEGRRGKILIFNGGVQGLPVGAVVHFPAQGKERSRQPTVYLHDLRRLVPKDKV